jgi:heme-degrading monooxygenase HmoA
MIARTWHGAVSPDTADDYHAYLLRTGVADYRATPGNAGAHVLRRSEDGVAHFLLLTLWETLSAIRAFAGDDVERARYYPEDEAYLLELEPHVRHYEVRMAPEQGSAEGAEIGRVWHGWTTPENADSYERLLREEILAGIADRNISGYRGVHLLRRELAEEVEWITVMWFDSLDAVRAFAGDEYEVAVVPEEARALLSRCDDRSGHYRVQSRA